ncbi:MAG: DEAD/DEAH box helicase [Candidatus Hodarchaeota archaeon]
MDNQKSTSDNKQRRNPNRSGQHRRQQQGKKPQQRSYNSFFDFNWKKKEIPKVLKDLKFEKPTEIQEKAIPLVLQGKTVIAQSKTGTGKTLAFATPSIDKINPDQEGIQVLAITPTRELCVQVARVFQNVGKPFNIQTLEVYGGVDIERQKKALRTNKVAVVVATPGRLIDLYKQRYINFSNIKMVILDEADRMLDMGFFPDIEYIFRKFPRSGFQLCLFSATIFEEIMEVIVKFTKGKHIHVRVGRNEDEFVIKEINQETYVILNRREKYHTLKKILRQEKPRHLLIFCNTISGVEFLEKRLKEDFKYPILGLTGRVSQNRREKILKMFKTQEIHHLIATDVASRGLDIPNITHVINYDVPQYPENYVHRIGRTGRMNKDKGGKTSRGKAITLVIQDEIIYFQRIEELIQKEVKKKSFEAEEEWTPRNPFRY